MRTAIIALAILALTAPAASADPHSTPLRALLAHLPDAGSETRFEIDYSDLAAIRALASQGSGNRAADPLLASLRSLPRPLAMQLRDPGSGWRETVGFSLSDIDRLVTLTAPPMGAMVLSLSPGSASAVPGALAEGGYETATMPPDDAAFWTRGNDFAPDFAAAHPDDPFGAGLGMASRVLLQGDLLLQGSGTPMLAAMHDRAMPRLADAPHVTALMGALDRVEAAGALVGATLWTDAAPLGLVDPLEIVPGTREASSEQANPWGAALLADFTEGAVSTGLMALTVTLPDDETADALRAHVAQAWEAAQAMMTGGSFASTLGAADIGINRAEGGLWVLAISASGETETVGHGIPRNAAFSRLRAAAETGDLPFLQP